MERFGIAAAAPAQAMLRHGQVDRFAALRLGARLVEANVAVAVDTPPFALEVVAVLRSSFPQVALPGLPFERNIRADVGEYFSNRPALVAKDVGHAGSARLVPRHVGPSQHRLRLVEVRRESPVRLRFPSAPDYKVEVIGTGDPASEKLRHGKRTQPAETARAHTERRHSYQLSVAARRQNG